MTDPHADTPVVPYGCDLNGAKAAVVLLHGRGASAQDILSLADRFYDDRIAYLAPQAAGNSWYPYSFLAPIRQNEPWLSSALAKVKRIVTACDTAGVAQNRVAVCGFSQGACLATEFVARHAANYGALIAFTGGLIGPPEHDLHHNGSLAGVRALFSSGDPDPHVPWVRVEASAEEYRRMGASVQLNRYPGRPHTILEQELDTARALILSILKPGLA